MKVTIGKYPKNDNKIRKIDIRIDDYDIWNMDSTLALIILPMLIKLKDAKQGSPYVEVEDVPENLRMEYTGENEETWKNYHDKWYWVLEEMIWTFQQLQPDYDWESQYESGEYDVDLEDIPGEPGYMHMVEGPNHTFKSDEEKIKLHQKRIDNGLRLFGKYYQALWT